jgi:hypothetical protein
LISTLQSGIRVALLFVSGNHFISSASYSWKCYTQHCNVQCGVHNESSLLLIPAAACRRLGTFRVQISLSTLSATHAHAVLDVIVNGSSAGASGCSGNRGFQSPFVFIFDHLLRAFQS